MKPAFLIALACMSSACAATTVRQYTDIKKLDGIAYYPPAHYLLVTFNGKGYEVAHVVLPDTKTLLGASPYAFAAQNHTILNFANGMLASGEVTTDETAVPSAMVSAAKEIVSAALKAGVLFDLPAPSEVPGAAATMPAPVLIRIDYTPSTWPHFNPPVAPKVSKQ